MKLLKRSEEVSKQGSVLTRLKTACIPLSIHLFYKKADFLLLLGSIPEVLYKLLPASFFSPSFRTPYNRVVYTGFKLVFFFPFYFLILNFTFNAAGR